MGKEIHEKINTLLAHGPFAHGASKNYLMKKYRMDAMALISEVEELVGKKFGISEDDLKAAFIAAVHSTAKAEAL